VSATQPPGKERNMQSIEMYFNDTIEKFSLFKQAAMLLIREIHVLAPDVVHQRCKNLSAMQEKLTENNEQLFIIMEFMGPGVLDNSSIGEIQRTLDKSVLACDTLYAEILAYKDNLSSRPRIIFPLSETIPLA
jgi:hypothetical protein